MNEKKMKNLKKKMEKKWSTLNYKRKKWRTKKKYKLKEKEMRYEIILPTFIHYFLISLGSLTLNLSLYPIFILSTS